MSLQQWIAGILTFQTYYRIIPQTDWYGYPYNISTWCWYWPFWVTPDSWQGFASREKAEEYLADLAL